MDKRSGHASASRERRTLPVVDEVEPQRPERPDPSRPALYELLCRECGRLTVGVTDADGCVGLAEVLSCGHDLSSRQVVFYSQPAAGL